MAQTLAAQYEKAIENYRRQAADHRARAANAKEGSWQQRADLRVAAKSDASADDLVRMQNLRSEQVGRIVAAHIVRKA